MYQIKVTWNPEAKPESYEFPTRNEILAFQLALEEIGRVSGQSYPHNVIKPRPHELWTILSTVLVGFWSIVWWWLIKNHFPDSITIDEYWKVGLCAALSYLGVCLVTRWFET